MCSPGANSGCLHPFHLQRGEQVQPPAIVEPFGPFFEHADGALAFDEFRCHGFSFTAMRAPVDRSDAATCEVTCVVFLLVRNRGTNAFDLSF